VGCGDGFVSMGLFNHLNDKKITAVDINLTDDKIIELNKLSIGINYLKELPTEGAYDIILLLDVLEHLEDDQRFLANLVDRYTAKGGIVMITVPAFQYIFSCHDVFLGHYRRYRLKEIENIAMASGLNVISSGYLFLSLLLPKLVYYKLLNSKKGSDGIGQWRRGRTISYLIESILNIDNNILMLAARYGVKIPGLTGWILCKKQG
jgi:trans-aconitate methyltransferase